MYSDYYKVMKRTLITVIFLYLSIYVYSQNEVPAPFVSRLQARAQRGSVLLSWKDSEDLSTGSYRIYRSKEEIGLNNYQEATPIADVSIGQESYVDSSIESVGDYFYAVLALTPNNTLLTSFIPYRNITISPVSITMADIDRVNLSKVVLKAEKKEGDIQLTFTSVPEEWNILFFRSTEMITDKDSLKEAIQVFPQQKDTSEYLDQPIPGIPYYYAIIEENSFENSQYDLIPGKNSLSSPVKVDLKKYELTVSETTSRPLPLPKINLFKSLSSDKLLPDSRWSLPVAVTLKDQTQTIMEEYVKSYEKRDDSVLKIRHLDNYGRDVFQNNTNLLSIIEGPFSAGKLSAAGDLLEAYLTLSLNDAERAAGRYYLGLCQYFLGNTKEALLQFLVVETYFPEEVKYYKKEILQKWVEESPFTVE